MFLVCFFFCYCHNKKGYKLLNLNNSGVFESRDVRFYEGIYPYKLFQLSRKENCRESIPQMSSLDYDVLQERTHTNQNVHENSDVSQNVPEETHENQDEENEIPVVRHSSRHHHPPNWMKDYYTFNVAQIEPLKVKEVGQAEISDEFSCFMSTHVNQFEPQNFKEAVKHKKWVEAMNEELEALESNDTWEITQLPKGKQAIGSKWIYRIKYKPNGEIDRYKARLVVLGNRQKHGIDYDQTFAPVAKMATVRSLLAVAAAKHWEIEQMDVKNAFLHGNLQESVYMKLPAGYKEKGGRIEQCDISGSSVQGDTKVCKLKKSLYGLKQAPRQWFAKLSEVLKEEGFIQSKCDYSLFSKMHQGRLVVLLIYVDDIILAGDDKQDIQAVKNFLSSKFHMKDLGSARYFLGLEIDKTHQGIFLCQKKYLTDLLKEHGLLKCRKLHIPLDATIKLTEDMGDPLPNPEDYLNWQVDLSYTDKARH